MGQSLRLAVYSDTCVVHTDIGYGWVHANIYFIFLQCQDYQMMNNKNLNMLTRIV